MRDIYFYSKLKKSTRALSEIIGIETEFSKIPNSWHVVVVDVENSTQAVEEGKHHQINLTATGAIISVLNTVRKKKKNIEIPYFFGGDGATFLLPDMLLSEIITVLKNYSLHIKRNTNLLLRVGHISTEELASEKTCIKILKHQLTPQLTIPIVLGNGLKKAEAIIKRTFVAQTDTNFKKNLLNLEGMQCRWEQISPVQLQKKVVCLLLDVPDENQQSAIYKDVLTQMNLLFGAFNKRQPIRSNSLKLDFRLGKILEEMKISISNKSLIYVLKHWIQTLFGKIYFNFSKEGKRYLTQIGQLSHTFMLDGTINTIFTAEQSKINEFISYLNHLEAAQKIVYGIHVTHASVMSCYVLDRKTKHAHFVDGTEGGYTSAAKMFKTKLATLK
ncbi:DUF3095 family protein [Maribacter sp. MAR_2009_72]|uniref:DUF3095 family protein n=1 Tax=Maribacter sp. MAR_2009_72 TaxID=1250050 RepID=UPI00119AF85A|nr:DUF3095 family protein [Maribacter sp. MAR_2009_72]TVZ14401.1 Protein of unknown function (DUF3095) [Maribacter sp. MAR_2009_72]